MKIQFKILIERFKKNILYITIYIVSLILGVYLFYLRNKQIPFNTEEFLTLINYPKFENLNYLYELIKIYSIGLLIYLIYDYYTYDLTYALDNIMIRQHVNKWYLNKVLVFIIFVSLFKIFEVSIIYLIYSSEVVFNINYYIYSIIFDVSVLLIVTTIYNYKRTILNYLFLIIIPYLYYKFNAICILILSIFIAIFNYKTLNFTNNFTK